MSPFLFILFSELLSRLLFKASSEGSLHGIKVSRTALTVDHLPFVDDLILFCRANLQEAACLKSCLEKYCCLIGQLINYGKSGLFFSQNLSRRHVDSLRNFLRLSIITNDALYLGNPLFLGRNKSKAFHFIMDKLKSCFAGLRSKLLSQAGRVTLVKSVVSSIPIYYMAACQFPASLCRAFDSAARQFFWNGKDVERKLSMVAWNVVCKPKSQGGLGIRSFELINKTLLAKLGWALAIGEERLWVKALKAKYFPNRDFLHYSKPS